MNLKLVLYIRIGNISINEEETKVVFMKAGKKHIGSLIGLNSHLCNVSYWKVYLNSQNSYVGWSGRSHFLTFTDVGIDAPIKVTGES